MKGNPQGNGTIAQARRMYEEIGLCYECGMQKEYCACDDDYVARAVATRNLDYCLGLVEAYPDNEYYQDRLADAIVAEWEVYHPELDETFLYIRFGLAV